MGYSILYGKKFIILVFICLFLGGIASAMPQKEDRLGRAEKLIEQKEYNKAITMLTEVIRENPNQAKEAEKMLRNIRRIRSDYNDLYSRLIDVLYQEKDVGKSLELIQQLESLDTSPSKATEEAVEEARVSAAFVYNLNKFEDIMQRAKGLLDEGKYWEAAQLYTTGFDMHERDFRESDYGEIIKNRVNSAMDKLGELTESFAQSKERHTQLENDVLPVPAAGPSDAFKQNLQQYIDFIRNLADWRKGIYNVVRILKQQNENLKSGSNEGKDDFYLSYMFRLADGRQKVDYKEGIIGAADILFSESLNRVADSMEGRLNTTLENVKTAYENGNWQIVSDETDYLSGMGKLYQNIAALWEQRIYLSDSYTIPENQWTIVEEKLPVHFRASTYRKAADAYLRLAELSEEEQKVYAPSGGTVDTLVAMREQMLGAKQNVRDVKEQFDALNNTYGDQTAEKYNINESIQIISTISSIAGATADKIQNRELDVIIRITENKYQPFEERYNNTKEIISNGRSLSQGVEEEVSEGEIITFRYPDRAIDRYEEAEQNLTELRETLNTFLEDIRGEPDFVLQAEEIQNRIEDAEALLNSISQDENTIAGYIEEAEQQLLLAQRYENEGFLRVREARSALNNNQFELAREKVSAARDRFLTSLDYQEDSQLRNESDTLLSNLAQEITRTQNAIVIRDVRNLISNAKDFYQQGNLDRAESLLLNAKSRWLTTHSEDNNEVMYWLRFVRTARNVKSGREIKKTDTLYDEMTRLLNLAKEDYQKARESISKGKQNEADKYFEHAKGKLLQVRIPFPFNREASVLSLKILQLQNPDTFEERFQQLFQEARQKIEVNPQEAYAELRDLKAIKPDFPGMDQAIYNCEIKLGIVVPPPNPEDLRRSRELYQNALRIFEEGERVNYNIAIEQLNRAIELNSDNQAAINLKDRIQIQMGGTSTVVISSTAEQQLRQAEEKFIEGSYYEAYSIVQRLWENPQNQRYQPLVELKRRIESEIQ